MAWGPDNALAWQEAAAYNGAPILLTGNGRIDLMRPELRSLHEAKAKELRAKYGSIILINTNFGALNHFYTNLTVLAPPEELGADGKYLGGWSSQAIATQFFARFSVFCHALQPAFRKPPSSCARILAKITRTWVDAAQGAKNVHVSHEGSVIPWILRARPSPQRLHHRP